MGDRRPAGPSAPIALGVTALALVAAAVSVASAPAAVWLDLAGVGPSVPPGIGGVAGAVVVAAVGWRLRAASADASFTLLALACVLAGEGAHDVVAALTPTAPSAVDTALRARVLAAYLDLFAAGAVVAGVWAAAPSRTLGRWVGPLVGAVLAWTVLGAAYRALHVYPAGNVEDLSGTWRSGLLLLAVWLLGAAGALRSAGLAHLADGRPVWPAPPPGPIPPSAWTTAMVGGVGVLAAFRHGLVVDDPGTVLGPLLWLLVGLVALRWSTTAGWTAFAASLTLGAEALLPESTIAGWALLLAATVAGWSALADAAPGDLAEQGRAVALAFASIAALPILAGADGAALAATVWTPAAGFPLAGAWTPALVFGPVAIALLVVLRRRLVPAVAEAEAVAGHPFAPARYIAALAAEALTGQARVRAEAVEAERRRLASDLHADVLPWLAQAAADTEAGASVDDVRAQLRTVESGLRGLVAERRHVVLDELGLVEALEWLAGRAEEDAGLEVVLELDPGCTDERPPRTVERPAFRVAQLAVDNAVRHAGATRIAMEVLASVRSVRVVVADDGRGFDPATPTAGFGLADMRLQAAEAGGRLELATAPGSGTRVAFSWPR